MEVRDNSPIGTARISLYDVAVGPTHFDFKLDKGSKAGRVKFDLKFSQVIDLVIRSTSLVCSMEENLAERFYQYNMYLLVSDL